ncbi:unnamed protein product, partial [Coregonus sp. 'balchen']
HQITHREAIPQRSYTLTKAHENLIARDERNLSTTTLPPSFGLVPWILEGDSSKFRMYSKE